MDASSAVGIAAIVITAWVVATAVAASKAVISLTLNDLHCSEAIIDLQLCFGNASDRGTRFESWQGELAFHC